MMWVLAVLLGLAALLQLAVHTAPDTLDAERALAEGLAARDLAHKKEIERVRNERDHFEHLLATGGVRVSVPATCRPVVASDPAAAGEPAEARAELDPAFAAAVAGITSDGDLAIVDLNACIDRYNEVRFRLNALNALNTLIGNTGAQTP
ncbi:lysis system i-spanin subunit Rz [Variovorax sp. PAMC26660]|uniref:lysis system i-spanin subunit Rz n=1 Tax=Variovorax sp. PAMC26660 TaxID=2762322 RepID=UPI00164D0415|nr:lysis system i-spanin subunit Rz [Variovorax sp. PAMC26660]QNK67750.1 lysis protein [Variovorax sp. PAMC26660]